MPLVCCVHQKEQRFLGDRLIDQSEYIQVLGYFDIDRAEAVDAFDKFAKVPYFWFQAKTMQFENEEGHQLLAIDEKKFLECWDIYFHSKDIDAAGNYLFGYI